MGSERAMTGPGWLVVGAVIAAGSCGPREPDLFGATSQEAPASSNSDAGIPSNAPSLDASAPRAAPDYCGGVGASCCAPPLPPCALGYQCEGLSRRCVDQPTDSSVTRLCRAASDCAPNERCCLSSPIGSCVAIGADEQCPVPDLTVSVDAPAPISRTVNAEDCAFAGLGTPGRRRLLRFAINIFNVGDGPLVLGDAGSPGVSWGLCGEALADNFIRYELWSSDGLLQSRRDAHLRPGCSAYAPASRFSCGLLGLEAGFFETEAKESFGITGASPFLDVTGVPPGDYVIRAIVNPPAEDGSRLVPERTYSNNEFDLRYTLQVDDPEAPCSLRNMEYWFERQCGWRQALVAECEPGTTLVVGCPDCSGDPVLLVCEGTEGCVGASAVMAQDDTFFADGSSILCPIATFVCPASGGYAAFEGSYSANDTSVSCVVREQQTADAGVEANP